ncbi:PH domain-containing protein [Georgenia satyanarayanai]|uniref:PH domain-containing protein n=1 Tax=Georgenia satyanarayanai TaxID=860221 RepID=UPI00203D8AF5|nr:PH domain-containing protein [Georgenia satyanarayanai]MCM3660240.1 PH domain-containing protein [Georgenia satyanarayanai]
MSDMPDRRGAMRDPFAPEGLIFTPVSAGLIKVRLISVAVWLGLPLVVLIVLAVLFPGWWWSIPIGVLVLLVAWLGWLVPRQVRSVGYAEREEDLLIRKGILFRQLTVVPYGRMQYVDVQAGPLDRWANVAKVQLHTASAQTDASIPGLPPEEASRLRDRLSERGESRLAGL